MQVFLPTFVVIIFSTLAVAFVHRQDKKRLDRERVKKERQISTARVRRLYTPETSEAAHVWEYVLSAIEDGAVVSEQIAEWVQNIESGGTGGGYNEFSLELNDEDPEYMEVYYIGLNPHTVMCTVKDFLAVYHQVYP